MKKSMKFMLKKLKHTLIMSALFFTHESHALSLLDVVTPSVAQLESAQTNPFNNHVSNKKPHQVAKNTVHTMQKRAHG